MTRAEAPEHGLSMGMCTVRRVKCVGEREAETPRFVISTLHTHHIRVLSHIQSGRSRNTADVGVTAARSTAFAAAYSWAALPPAGATPASEVVNELDGELRDRRD